MEPLRGTGLIKLRPAAAIWREVDGEAVIYDVESSTYLGANRSGTVLWRAMAEGASRDELIQRLLSAFGIDADRAGSVVDGFVEACRTRDLLED